MPYIEEELEDLLRDTAIALGVLDPRTKQKYHEYSNVQQVCVCMYLLCARARVRTAV